MAKMARFGHFVKYSKAKWRKMADFWAQLRSVKNMKSISYDGIVCICELKMHSGFQKELIMKK